MGAGEAKQVDGIGPGMNATLARAEIVPGLQLDCLDAPRQGRGARKQVSVGHPHRTLDDRRFTSVTNEITQQGDAIEAKGAERVAHARH